MKITQNQEIKPTPVRVNIDLLPQLLQAMSEDKDKMQMSQHITLTISIKGQSK